MSEYTKRAVRLSVLNPQVRERVEKFDTGNDGELDINEAIQGLVALQKQSNNYKKMIWLLIPILSLMIAATFGTTILAINLTKDINQNNGILTSKLDNTPIRTVETTSKDLMHTSFFSNDYNQISKLHFGRMTINVNDIYQLTEQDATKTVYINSDMIFLGVNQNGSFMIHYNQGYETNPMAQLMYQTINQSFSEVSMVMDYYRSTFGYQPTFDDIQRYVYMYTVTTSKVPEEYSVSQDKSILSSNLVSSSTRMEALEASGDSPCQDGGYFEKTCAKNPCFVCERDTFGNSITVCTSSPKWERGDHDCKRDN